MRPVRPSDAAILAGWDRRPHVREAIGADDPSDWDAELAGDPPWRDWWIAEADGRPVGIVQISDPAAEPSRYWGEIGAGHRAIDIWLGEPDVLGRGLGTAMMRFALARAFAPPDVGSVLVDPLERNRRARRFYARLGFVEVGPRRFGDDDCIVCRLDRARFVARSLEFGLEGARGAIRTGRTGATDMAGQQTQDHAVDPNEVPQVDMIQHQQTYEAFLNLIKIGIAAVAILLIGMAVFLI